MDDKTYTKYFNHGYFLLRKEPKLLKHLLATMKDRSEVEKPLTAGMEEYKKERLNERLQRLKDTNNELGLER